MVKGARRPSSGPRSFSLFRELSPAFVLFPLTSLQITLSGEWFYGLARLFWSKNKTNMKKIVLTYGLIAGVIVSSMLVITQPLFRNGTLNIDNGVYVGFGSMIIAMSLIFFAIKSYRDQHLQGVITFGKAFKVGILIALIASLMYVCSIVGNLFQHGRPGFYGMVPAMSA